MKTKEETEKEEKSDCCNAEIEQYFDPLNSYYGVAYRCAKCGMRLFNDELIFIE